MNRCGEVLAQAAGVRLGWRRVRVVVVPQPTAVHSSDGLGFDSIGEMIRLASLPITVLHTRSTTDALIKSLAVGSAVHPVEVVGVREVVAASKDVVTSQQHRIDNCLRGCAADGAPPHSKRGACRPTCRKRDGRAAGDQILAGICSCDGDSVLARLRLCGKLRFRAWASNACCKR